MPARGWARSPTNNSGLRSGAHDPERPGEVVAQRGCGWSGLVHPRDARVAGRNNSRAPINRLGSISQKPFLQHFRLLARFFKGLFRACVSPSITIGCGSYTSVVRLPEHRENVKLFLPALSDFNL